MQIWTCSSDESQSQEIIAVVFAKAIDMTINLYFEIEEHYYLELEHYNVKHRTIWKIHFTRVAFFVFCLGIATIS